MGAKEGRCVAAIDRHQYEKRRSPALVSGDIGLGSTGTELSLSFCEAFFFHEEIEGLVDDRAAEDTEQGSRVHATSCKRE